MVHLPEVAKGKTLEFDHFPTKMQAVIFRAWESVPAERIALTLGTTVENITRAAYDMGLAPQGDMTKWQNAGYITTIKAMWHLLPYSQLMTLLDYDAERLSYVIKEDDFLNVKLGFMKPDCEEVLWRELSAEEKLRTAEIKKAIEQNGIDTSADCSAPFDFFDTRYEKIKQDVVFDTVITDEWCIKDATQDPDVALYAGDFKKALYDDFGISLCENGRYAFTLSLIPETKEDAEYHEIEVKENGVEIRAAGAEGILRALYHLLSLCETLNTFSLKCGTIKRRPLVKTRYIYSFCGLYGDVLDKDGDISFPEPLLREYAKKGINGLWIQAVLYKITPFPFDESLSEGWQMRLDNLKKLSERVARYGIKFYLYLNEPRSMPLALFDKHPEIKGNEYPDGTACLCTLTEPVKQYLEDSVSLIIKEVPRIGGFFCISKSENHTNCCSHTGPESKGRPVNCPRCSKEKDYIVVAKTIKIMADAAFAAKPDIKFFAWDWAWARNHTIDEIAEIIKHLPEKVVIMCVSESLKPLNYGGIDSEVDDYCLSVAGPSDWTKGIWKIARENGHECAAKIQINNTWECSTATFLPVYDTILKHMENLRGEDIRHMMLSWTLGGYPSDNINIASSFFFEQEGMCADEAYDSVLSAAYGSFSDTVKKAAGIFSEAFAEFPFEIGAVYHGPQNIGTANLLFERPTGFVATMTGFPYDYILSWRNIFPEEIYVSQYEKLCAKWEKGLEVISSMPSCEFTDMAHYGYTLFKSTLNQTKFVLLRDIGQLDSEETRSIILDEKKMAADNYRIMQRNSTIGYEAANHYYVSKTMLLEKIVQCEYLLGKTNSI